MTPRLYGVAAAVAFARSSGKPVASDTSLNQDLLAKQNALEAREAELKRREMALANAPRPTAVSSHAAAGSELLPPGAKPGECYTRVWMEPQYKSTNERQLMSEASERIEVIPAKYQTGTKRIMVQEASTKLVTVPATYKTVTERVMVRPASERLQTIPATYETKTTRVIDKPAHTVWKKGAGPIQRISSSTGEIMCLVEVPATYKTISKRVIKTPATTRSVSSPAEYKTVTRRVVDREAYSKETVIPAKYSTVKVTELVTPAQERRIAIPAKYQTVTKRELVVDGEMQWREILCDTNTHPGKVREIQSALKSAGHNPGAIDGVFGVLTAKTVRALGLSLR